MLIVTCNSRNTCCNVVVLINIEIYSLKCTQYPHYVQYL